ncbi:MAG: class I SAM-dependent methyltransferase, partial [Deltaproteobacteria bacterium]|nr:class I SAM-dependent methyltransferase [Deltaproteobacteria bacterium]
MPRNISASKSASGTLASRADKYDLYIRSVQSPDVEVAFFDRVFRNHYGHPPLVLREDFCGTALVCYEWVKSRSNRTAIGVDLDPEPLEWGRRKLMPELRGDAARRLRLIEGDVRTTRAKADIISAQNFSYFCFETRSELRDYFAHARRHLGDEGLLVLDALGGSEVLEDDREEVTSFRGFKYVWHQVDFDPVSHHCKYAIHFRFKDGSELKNAFRYEWRLWTLPELRELLVEAGFGGVDIYWEATDRETGDGNGV